MKRCSTALVTYSSSDDGDDERPAKKRKLPSLSSFLVPNLPVDNPAQHQGRIRTKPHVEGQFAAHVYVPLVVEQRSPLCGLIDEILDNSKDLVPTLTALWPRKDRIKRQELHISLSHPTFLRAHQREDLKKAVKSLSKQFSPRFTISFAALSELTNDEKTRTFLALEIGAGHHELRTLSNTLSPALQAIRQKEFYSNPRFHASIAWALLDRPLSESRPESVLIPRSTFAEGHPEQVTEAGFPTIPHFPKELIPTLNSRHGVQLASIKTGSFDINEISLKIGKEVYTWKLSA
ncbi:U6 snRNA phosphodiesterase Usb1 [Collybia nuda]|uniref:U6 snRNA phosphodiesterase n=1 Tax=Collybia nuda TaxID=64659 RepID=A0A9P5Y472_9AGAR|nr:U6 snRNA phosphodiesterase Usb1 [Collybia nuda]